MRRNLQDNIIKESLAACAKEEISRQIRDADAVFFIYRCKSQVDDKFKVVERGKRKHDN